MAKHIFGTVLTHAAPSANHRGESDENILRLQTLRIGDNTHSVVSSLAIRNRLRDVIIDRDGTIMNRRRHFLINNPQPCVKYNDAVNPEKYLDDYVFGYVCPSGDNLADSHPFNLKSSILVNHAVSLTPFDGNFLLQQYPKKHNENGQEENMAAEKNKKKGKNKEEGGEEKVKASTGGLLSVETHFTAYQFPFSLEHISKNGRLKWKPDWVKMVLKGIGEIGFVAGNHSRTQFDFSPRSIILRVTDSCAPQYNCYGFDEEGNFSDLDRISSGDLKSEEFWIAGDIIRNMDESKKKALVERKVHMNVNCQKLLEDVAEVVCKVM